MDSFYYNINLRVLRKDPLAQPHVFEDGTILYRPRDLTRVFPDPLLKAFALKTRRGASSKPVDAGDCLGGWAHGMSPESRIKTQTNGGEIMPATPHLPRNKKKDQLVEALQKALKDQEEDHQEVDRGKAKIEAARKRIGNYLTQLRDFD